MVDLFSSHLQHTRIRCVILLFAPCQIIQDRLGFWNPCCVYSGTEFWNPDTGFRIPCQCNLDSGFFERYSDSKAQDSGFYKKNFRVSAFQKEKFPGIRNPDSLTWEEIVLYTKNTYHLAGKRHRFS